MGRHFTGTCQWHSMPHPPRFPQPGRAGTHDAPLAVLIRARRGTTQSLTILTTPSSSHLKHRLERAQSRRPMRHGGDLGHRHRALPDLLHGHPEGQRGLGVPEAVGPRAPPRAGDYPPGLRAHSARLGRPRPSWRACRRRGTCAAIPTVCRTTASRSPPQLRGHPAALVSPHWSHAASAGPSAAPRSTGLFWATALDGLAPEAGAVCHSPQHPWP